MATDETDRRVDDKGRITIPRAIRDRLGLESGDQVAVSLEDGTVCIRPNVSREAFAETMAGCIDEATRDPDAEPIDPLTLSDDWTEDLP